MIEDPKDKWTTKNELISSTLVFIGAGLFCLLMSLYSDMGPIAIFGTAFFFFLAGVGSAPLFYKFWFKAED